MLRPTLLASAVLASALTVRAGAQPPAPDLIIHHARIYTAVDAHPAAAALAIRGDRLVAVGQDAEILALKGAATQVVDLGGRTVVPGLTDAHGHFTNLGSSLQRLDFRGLTSYDAIVAMVKARAATARPGEWILGRAWDQNLWKNKAFPTHDKLDAAAPNNPVYLTRVDGHAGLANAKAMQLAAVTRATEAPAGGRLIRDANGNPSGVFVDGAQELVAAKIPPESDALLDEQILLADKECRRLGLTMVHDAGNTKRAIDAYKRLADAGTLQTRIYAMVRGSLADLAPFFKAGPIANYHDYHVIVRAIKIIADGALGSRGAAMLEDYSDEPGNKGLLTTPPEEVYAQTLAASKAGFQTCIHAIGDRANREVLDVFARVQKEVPGSKSLRMRDEHAQILNPQDIPRFAQLSVIASMQPTHCTSDMPWVPARIGQKRTADGAYVWQKLMKSGVVLASGSDFPVEQPNPMLGLYAAITRQDVNGNPPGGWAPDQRMTRMEALKSFTINAAYAAHMEKELGTLEGGKLADLVVLSGDVMTEPAKDILTTTVIKTMIGGRWIYGSGAQR
ncbi:MAG TPA: amidohydrolase family protein [Vicinamibacterales bacterium]|nr:amidohydrolase family protein [Vicinamibacterales bacterium]